MDNTFTLTGGKFTRYGGKTTLHLTASSNIVSAETEVNVTPQWQAGHPLKEILDSNIQTGMYDISDISGNGTFPLVPIVARYVLYCNEKNIGTRLNSFGFPSASDKNTSDTVTISYADADGTDPHYGDGTVLSCSIDLGNLNEITTASFNLTITNGNPATFLIETKSNFGPINQKAIASWYFKALDSQNQITRLSAYPEDNVGPGGFYGGDLASGNNVFNQAYFAEYRLEIDNNSEACFIVTESNTLNVADNLTTSSHLDTLEWNLGNEDNPDYSLVEFYLKDRDRKDNNSNNDIDDVFQLNNFVGGGLGLLDEATIQSIFEDGSSNIAKYTTPTSSLILSASDKVSDDETGLAQNRYFKVTLDDDARLGKKLTAKDSPYILPVSTSVNGAVHLSSSIILTVNNLDPVWTTSSMLITSSWNDLSANLANIPDSAWNGPNLGYPSASDPGGDNITITRVSDFLDPVSNYVTITANTSVNEIEGSNTGSFTIDFNYTVGAPTSNGEIKIKFTAEDEVSPTPGSATHHFTASYMVPPLFDNPDSPSDTRALTQTVNSDESDIGSDLDSFTFGPAFSSYLPSIALDTNIQGICNLDTGSQEGFIITSDDDRVLDSWFTFEKTNAIGGNNATYTISTSSLFGRIDADVTATLIVTASDYFNQTASNTITIQITNEDTIEDVVPQFSSLRAFIAPGITGSTSYLANDVPLESTLAGSDTVLLNLSGLTETSPRIDTLHHSPAPTITLDTLTTANGVSVSHFKTTDGSDFGEDTPRLRNSIVSGKGTFIMWYKKNGSGAGTIIQSSTNPNFKVFTGTGTNLVAYWGAINEDIIDADHFTNYSDYYQLAFTWDATEPNPSNFTVFAYGNKDLLGSEIVNDDITTDITSNLYLGSGSSGVADIDIALIATYNKNLTAGEIEDFFHAFSGSFGYS